MAEQRAPLDIAGNDVVKLTWDRSPGGGLELGGRSLIHEEQASCTRGGRIRRWGKGFRGVVRGS